MTQVAIKLSFENATKILNTESIAPELFFDWLEKYGDSGIFNRMLDQTYYFIPNHTTFFGSNVGCVVVRNDCLEKCFEYDPAKIDTEFVPVKQHSPI